MAQEHRAELQGNCSKSGAGGPGSRERFTGRSVRRCKQTNRRTLARAGRLMKLSWDEKGREASGWGGWWWAGGRQAKVPDSLGVPLGVLHPHTTPRLPTGLCSRPGPSTSLAPASPPLAAVPLQPSHCFKNNWVKIGTVLVAEHSLFCSPGARSADCLAGTTIAL